MTEFSQLLEKSGLTIRSAASLLGVGYSTAAAYKYGTLNTPPEVIKKMKACVKAHERVFDILTK